MMEKLSRLHHLKVKEALDLGDVLRLLFQRDMLLLVAGSFMALLNLFVAVTVLPLYVLHLGGTAADAGWQAGLFTFSAIALRSVVGPLADRYGRRRLLVLGSAAYGLAPLGLLLADSLGTVAVLRVFQALGSAAFLSAASALATDLSPRSLRATGLGVLGVFKSLALGLAPPLGMAVADQLGFRTLFLLCTVVGAVGTACVVLVREPSARSGPAVSGASPARRGDWASVLAQAPARLALASMAVVAVAYGAVMTFVPVYGQELGLPHHGLYFPIMAAAAVVGSLVAGRLADSLGRVTVLLPVLALNAVGVAAAGALAAPGAFVVSALLVGQGFAGAFAVLGALLAENVGDGQRGLVFALQENAIDTGMTLGALAVGMAAGGAGYTAGFGGIGALCLLWTAWLRIQRSRGLAWPRPGTREPEARPGTAGQPEPFPPPGE